MSQLFNHLEKRLARALLRLSRFGHAPAHGYGRAVSAAVSVGALAEMIGATAYRVKSLLNQFRRLGLVDFGSTIPSGEIRVHPKLLTDIVLDG